MYQDYLNEIDNIRTSQSTIIILSIVGVIVFTAFLWLLLYALCGFDASEVSRNKFLGIVSTIGIICVLPLAMKAYFNSKDLIEIIRIKQEYEIKAPKEWVKKEEQILYPIKLTKQEETIKSSVLRVLNGDNIEYSYQVGSDQGYQLNTLKKQYESIKEKDIFIEEIIDLKEAKLVYEKQEFKEKAFNKELSISNQRIRFIVPDGTVTTVLETESKK